MRQNPTHTSSLKKAAMGGKGGKGEGEGGRKEDREEEKEQEQEKSRVRCATHPLGWENSELR